MLPSFEDRYSDAVPDILVDAGQDSPVPSGLRRSPRGDQPRMARRGAKRVLMLGRLRELALYRAEVLGNYGYQVLAPETEVEAVAHIREGNFDVAVLSYTLPDAAIQHYAELLRQHRPDCPILAIAQSRLVDRRIEPDAVVLGDRGPAELVAALRKLLPQD